MANHVEHLFADYPAILSAKDIAEVLGLNNKTVYEYLQAGTLPGYHIGTKWVLIRDEVVEFIARSSNVADRESPPIRA